MGLDIGLVHQVDAVAVAQLVPKGRVGVVTGADRIDGIKRYIGHYQETDDLSSALPMLARKSVDQVERELVYQALLSLGVEIREMKLILLNLDHNMGSQAIHNDAEDIYYLDREGGQFGRTHRIWLLSQ